VRIYEVPQHSMLAKRRHGGPALVRERRYSPTTSDVGFCEARPQGQNTGRKLFGRIVL
jgi:hypothetical protein